MARVGGFGAWLSVMRWCWRRSGARRRALKGSPRCCLPVVGRMLRGSEGAELACGFTAGRQSLNAVERMAQWLEWATSADACWRRVPELVSAHQCSERGSACSSVLRDFIIARLTLAYLTLASAE